MKIYDADIRALLFSSFMEVEEYTSEEDTIVVCELDVCSGISRVDISVINGQIHGYEIKSKQDNLERLSKQSKMYGKVFDTLTIAAYESHAKKLTQSLPEWWGIQIVTSTSGGLVMNSYRKAATNPDVDIQYVAMLLWREEMNELLIRNGYNRGIKSKTRQEMSKIIARELDGNLVKDYVRTTLKSRQSWKAHRLQQLCGD